MLNLAMIVFSALLIWKAAMVAANSDSPVVVVLSGSMEPAFQRGDILLLNNNREAVSTGDIVVFKVAGRDIPIVHRVLRVHEHNATHAPPPPPPGGFPDRLDILTKGDNNQLDDRNLYVPGQLWLSRNEVIGVAFGSVPYVGMVTIMLNDYPALKYVLVGVMAIFVLTSREG